MKNKPYTYLIGWSKLGFWYYGVRYSKNCFPSDLWVSYFTSSNSVKKFRKQFGEPDVVEIRRTFDDRSSAIDWERRVIGRINAVNSDAWLNRTDNKAIHPDDAIRGAKQKKPNRKRLDDMEKKRRSIAARADGRGSRLNTDDAKRKSATANRARVAAMTPEERIVAASAMNTRDSRLKAMNTRATNSENMTPEERIAEVERRSLAAKKGIAGSSYSASNDAARNAKISEFKKANNPCFATTTECPHCGNTGQYASMKRWHFDACSRISVYGKKFSGQTRRLES